MANIKATTKVAIIFCFNCFFRISIYFCFSEKKNTFTIYTILFLKAQSVDNFYPVKLHQGLTRFAGFLRVNPQISEISPKILSWESYLRKVKGTSIN